MVDRFGRDLLNRAQPVIVYGGTGFRKGARPLGEMSTALAADWEFPVGARLAAPQMFTGESSRPAAEQ